MIAQSEGLVFDFFLREEKAGVKAASFFVWLREEN